MMYLRRVFKRNSFIEKVETYFTNAFKKNIGKAKHNYTSKKPRVSIQSSDDVFIEKLYQILDKNIFEENLKAGKIANELHMSHSSMYKKIKLITGKSYVQFIREYRLSIAKVLLEKKGYSVSDTCYMTGYSDRKYFSKLFKKQHGNTPSFYYKKKELH